MVVILVGFMGCGKSSVLTEWSKNPNLKTADLDHLISATVGVDPSNLGEWIEKVGLSEFRKKESQVLKEYCEGLSSTEHSVLALGGGAFSDANREMIEGVGGVTVWIDTPLKICWDRVKDDSNRPLAQKGFESFQDLYKERLSFYEKAKYRLSGDAVPLNWDEFCKKFSLFAD